MICCPPTIHSRVNRSALQEQNEMRRTVTLEVQEERNGEVNSEHSEIEHLVQLKPVLGLLASMRGQYISFYSVQIPHPPPPMQSVPPISTYIMISFLLERGSSTSNSTVVRSPRGLLPFNLLSSPTSCIPEQRSESAKRARRKKGNFRKRFAASWLQQDHSPKSSSLMQGARSCEGHIVQYWDDSYRK